MSILNYLRNKSAPYILSVGLASSLLTACKQVKTEISDVLHEDAKVVGMEHKNSWMQPMPIHAGKIRTIYFIHHPERNIISFDGKVDFEINNKEVFSRFKQGDSASVSYRQSYRLTFDDIDGDGKKDLVNKVLVDYDFLDAQPKKN